MTYHMLTDDDDARPVECQDCGWRGKAGDTHAINDIFERVAPGETMPAGECPECHALAHLDHRDKPRRWYVSATWDDWPGGGSYGTVVTAATRGEAEALCWREMAAAHIDSLAPSENLRADVTDDMISAEVDRVVDAYIEDWFIVDCFDLDEFVARHRP